MPSVAKRERRLAAVAVATLAASAVAGMAVGPVPIGFGEIVQSAAAKLPLLGVHSPLSGADATIVWQLRAPRVVLAMLVGGMLALAGASYQAVFRNPLADPYLLGVAGGAGFGATIVIAYAGGSGSALLAPAAFAGAILAVAGAYALGRSVEEGRSPAALVLAGVTVAAFFTALQTFLQQQHSDTLQTVYSWILGHLDVAGWHDVLLVLPYVVISAAVLLLHRRILDVLTVGDEEAASLGIDVRRVRAAVVAAATLGTAAAVAASGLIGFVGIIVPHAIRLASGAGYRMLLPLSLAFGGAFLVAADLAARTLIAPAEIPVGIITAFLGAPFFAVVMRTARTAA
jgi:iron complex transport system permease protein